MYAILYYVVDEVTLTRVHAFHVIILVVVVCMYLVYHCH
jgi:quinol-cytochrome oxidoreductase complex cytochrome b subunit